MVRPQNLHGRALQSYMAKGVDRSRGREFGPSVGSVVYPTYCSLLTEAKSELVKARLSHLSHPPKAYQFYQSPYNHLCDISTVLLHLSYYIASFFLFSCSAMASLALLLEQPNAVLRHLDKHISPLGFYSNSTFPDY